MRTFLGIIALSPPQKIFSEIEDKIIWLEKNFWDQLRDLLEDQEAADLVDWFLKV